MVDFIHFLDHIYLLSIATHLLTHFVRSLIRLAFPSLRCGRFAAHLLTHFIWSLVHLVLPSLRCSRFAAVALPLTCSLTSFVRSFALHLLTLAPSCSLRLLLYSLRSYNLAHFVSRLLIAPLGRYQQVLTSLALVDSLVPSISIATCEFVFRFAQYNSRSRGRPSDTFLNVHSLC